MNSDNAPFYYNKKLHVNFISSNLSKFKNIELNVEYRIDNLGPIKGFFKIGKERFEELKNFVKQHKIFKLESISKSNKVYCSDDVKICKYRDSNVDNFIVYSIEMYNFHSKFNYEGEKSKYVRFDYNDRTHKPFEEKRYLEFQLFGPTNIWDRAFIPEFMKNNTSFITEINQNNKFEIENFKCSYFVKDILFQANCGNEYYEINKKRVFFRIEEIADDNSADVDFEKTVLDFFEKLLLLISFASSSNIDWLIYNFNGKKYYVWYLKSILNSDKFFKDEPRLNIETYYLNKFLINSYKNLIDLEKNNINIIKPIREYLSNEYAIYLDQKFIIVYIAFEKLTNDISNWKFQNELTIDKKKFDKIRDELKILIKNNYKNTLDEKQLESINEKLIELNKTSLKRKLEMIFKHFEISYDKSIDENGNFRFLTIRNKYMHSTKNYEDNDLLYEYLRLTKYFELIVLKLLDKDSLSHLHPDFKYNWEQALQ